ncbi:MAG TPA: Rieske 2Fe-2S domain-containing protein [Burkholderiales bacterium]
MRVAGERLICAAEALTEGGDGVRFTVTHGGEEAPAFAIRYQGRVHAYLNRCAHRRVELDWEPGRFFDRERRFLICATHGALYEPSSGRCVAGPCAGRGLVKLEVLEKNNAVFLVSEDTTER